MNGPVQPRPAATIILLRRGGRHRDRGLEVLMVRRSEHARFMPGVWVFPGGAVDPGDTASAADADAAHRRAAVRELGEEAGVELGADAELLPWSRWITPEVVPVRFDTRFYVALAPAHCVPEADGEEMVDARWMVPADALGGHERERFPLSFPTVRHLEELRQFASADEVLAAAAGRSVEPILPRVVPGEGGDGHRILRPGDEGI